MHDIHINIWSGNAQEEFMGSVLKLLSDCLLGRKQSGAHKHNYNPAEHRIQDIKGTTLTFLDRSGATGCSWLLCMEYVVLILNCMAHRSLYWRTPHEAAYTFTPDVSHLMEFKFWEPIIILYDKTQFPESCEIFDYYDGPAPNKYSLKFSWVWAEEHGLLARSVLCHAKIPTTLNYCMVPFSG